MAANNIDCDITLRLEELFHEYVSLYTKLYMSGDNAGVPDERFEMALKLESANEEMSELVMQLQSLQSDAEHVANITTQTISAVKRSSMLLSAVGA